MNNLLIFEIITLTFYISATFRVTVEIQKKNGSFELINLMFLSTSLEDLKCKPGNVAGIRKDDNPKRRDLKNTPYEEEFPSLYRR